ncbi:acetate kinase [Acetitomaculum ruminis DSM 5522]|uniref:Acetate kinase n=1 Tax=Acetitomaculum ruminis DSM 5522 TaxID=1120918 RepID=A0A1I0VPZ5_9FIRM|nr:acetate kinase [Acetitomaculum ruminis]SFA78422.1 acetate kinase [Acetitomaculum ruminis DSM 5522]
MKVLVLNCGSSSLKYQLIDMETEGVLAKGLCERIGIDGSVLTHKVPGKDDYVVEKAMPNHEVAVKMVMDVLVDPDKGVISDTKEIAAVGHRVLHGGTVYSDSIVVNEDVKKVIKDCIPLGPLHNPANLMGIEACEAAMPGTPNVAVFDTAFGMGMEESAYLYAIPYKYYEKYGIRRYGFHGTSHKFVSGEIIKFANLPEGHRKVIVCHLGNGASISASIDGKCVDTSMGLTPLEGLIMGTRSGDVDPAVVQFLANNEKLTVDEVLNILNKESGILGLSEVSSDFRDVEKAEAEGNHKAAVANAAYRHRVIKYIGAYVAAMNGVDAIAFTAGVGENDASVRKLVCEGLSYLGVKIDDAKNNGPRGVAAQISTDDSAVKVYVYPTNEELAIARETLALVK